MKKVMHIALMAALALVTLSCGQGKKGGQASPAPLYREFPSVTVPSMYGDREGAAQYLSAHFWDEFFRTDGVNDTSAVLGVRIEGLEKAFANYVGILDYVSLSDAQAGIRTLFGKVCEAKRRDSTSHVYTVFAQTVEKYLYDPNSPLRNEDYFLPYVKALSESDFTAEELRPSYEYQTRMCSLNQGGTPAADFGFCRPDGTRRQLYSVRADYTVLFFSNPGCNACKEIIDALTGIPDIEGLVKSARVAIVNIYIDEELDKWREYLPNYPKYWICGYDYRYIIRKDTIYNVRAIPSLYLLDADKRVICKDAPTDKLINKLTQLLCQ